VPLAVVVAGANRHDMKLAGPTLESIVIERPKPTKKHPQNMCMDKGYDFPEVGELVAGWGYTAHIARRGVDQSKRRRVPGYRARRWVVEDELLDEQVQAPPDQVGEEAEELPGDDASRLRMDNLPASGNYRIGSKSSVI
jgi:hypothetical protein